MKCGEQLSQKSPSWHLDNSRAALTQSFSLCTRITSLLFHFSPLCVGMKTLENVIFPHDSMSAKSKDKSLTFLKYFSYDSHTVS